MDFELTPLQERWLSIAGGIYALLLAAFGRLDDEDARLKYLGRIVTALLGAAMIVAGILRYRFKG